MGSEIGLCYFIDEERLEIYSEEFFNVILRFNVKFSASKIKELMKNDNVYVYPYVVFKKPLSIDDIDEFMKIFKR